MESLYQAWQQEAFVDTLQPVIVDITSITEADQDGRALLVVMHRFGTQIIAKSRESFAIAQPIVTEPLESVSKQGWFGRLIGFFRLDRPSAATFSPFGDLISRISAHHRLGKVAYECMGDLGVLVSAGR